MEQLKRELLLLKSKLQSLVQIGSECKNLITFSEGFVKRDLSLIRLNCEIKLRKLEEKHVNEIKILAKEERETIDWEMKCIQEETLRLEKTAEEFQTAADKQKARVFQDEVRFLQKIIEKAARKFKRKKLKFNMNRPVQQFFDSLESFGSVDTELVDLSSVGTKTNNKANENHQCEVDETKQIKVTLNEPLQVAECNVVINNTTVEVQDTAIFKDKEEHSKDFLRKSGSDTNKHSQQQDPEKDTREDQHIQTTGTQSETRNEKAVSYENTPRSVTQVIERTELDTISEYKTDTLKSRIANINEIGSKETPDVKASLPLTEAGWMKYRDLELNKRKCVQNRYEHDSKSLKQNVSDKTSRISVLQELCDRLDVQSNESSLNRDKSKNKPHFEDKAVGTNDRHRHQSTGNTHKSDIYKPSHTSNELKSSGNMIRSLDDAGDLNKPKGILKNWPHEQSRLRRSKSDSSKYSNLRNEKFLLKSGKPGSKCKNHVKFADIEAQPCRIGNCDEENVREPESLQSIDSNPKVVVQTISIDGSQDLAKGNQSVNESSQFSYSIFPRTSKSLTNFAQMTDATDKLPNKLVHDAVKPDTFWQLEDKNICDRSKPSDVVKSCSMNIPSVNPSADKLNLNVEMKDGQQTPRSIEVGFAAGTEKFDLNSFRTTIEKLRNEISDKSHGADTSISNEFKTTLQNPEVICKSFQTTDIKGTNGQSIESDPMCSSDVTFKNSELFNSDNRSSADHQEIESNEDSMLDCKTPSGYNLPHSNGFKVSNARIAAYVRRRLKAVDYPISSSNVFSTPNLSESLPVPGPKDQKYFTDTNKKSNDDLKLARRSEANEQVHNAKQTRQTKQRLPSSEEMLFNS